MIQSVTSQKSGGTRPPSPREVNSRGSSPAVGRFAPSGLTSLFPRLIEMILQSYLFNNSGKFNDSWRKGFLPSVEMTASFVIPNECEESRFMLRIS